MRKVLWALVVGLFLSSIPLPAAAFSPAYASCRKKKAKKYKVKKFNGKYKAPKLKKGHKRHHR